MNSEENKIPSLREMELEVEAEGREWMRRRLEEKLQAQADRQGGVFPPQRAQSMASASGGDAVADGLRAGGVGRMAGKKSK
jgi:hypothetical protein